MTTCWDEHVVAAHVLAHMQKLSIDKARQPRCPTYPPGFPLDGVANAALQVVSFDHSGASWHPNHIAAGAGARQGRARLCHARSALTVPRPRSRRAAMQEGRQMLALETVPVYRKYLGMADMLPSALTNGQCVRCCCCASKPMCVCVCVCVCVFKGVSSLWRMPGLGLARAMCMSTAKQRDCLRVGDLALGRMKPPGQPVMRAACPPVGLSRTGRHGLPPQSASLVPKRLHVPLTLRLHQHASANRDGARPAREP
jgi:hypothetical protein